MQERKSFAASFKDIPDGVAEVVVYIFEIIDIKKYNGQTALLSAVFDSVFQTRIKISSVKNTGEMIRIYSGVLDIEIYNKQRNYHARPDQ
jgi:uncharacterized membrane protein HdeD (DUF308 family)